MEDDRKNRFTYCNKQQQVEQLMGQVIEDLRVKHPTCEAVLQAVTNFDKLTEHPELATIFTDNPSELNKLVKIALQPESVGVKKPGWSFLARNIIKPREAPNVIRDWLFEPNTNRAQVLFAFLRDNPNDTQLGYFREIMRSFKDTFYDQLLAFLKDDKDTCSLCLEKAFYPDVFCTLFDTIILSNNQNVEFKDHLVSQLLGKLAGQDHQQEYAEIINDILDEIDANIDRVSEPLKIIVARHLNKQFCQSIVTIISNQAPTNEQHCEYLVEILTKIIDIYRKLQNQQFDITPLQQCVVGILKSMNSLTSILKTPSEKQIPFPNGQNVRSVGMLRYYLLELLHNVLQLDPKTVSAHFDLAKGGILGILEMYITVNPWNNMIHALICNIAVALINRFEDYREFNYVGNDGFLAFIIQTFKTHDYVYLNTMNISTFGYIHYLYFIAKAVCLKLEKSETLRQVMNDFKPWASFLVDLQDYEAKLDEQLGEPQNQVKDKKLKNHESIRRIVIDMNAKESDKGESQDLLERFYEVIQLNTQWPRQSISIQNTPEKNQQIEKGCRPKSKSAEQKQPKQQTKQTIEPPPNLEFTPERNSKKQLLSNSKQDSIDQQISKAPLRHSISLKQPVLAQKTPVKPKSIKQI